MEIDKIPQWILSLEQEDVTFLKNFVLKSGSLKEIAKTYGVTYPTVRLRLDKLIQKIEMSDQKEEEPFTTFVKGLAVDSRIDLEPAKIIIENYKKEKERCSNDASNDETAPSPVPGGRCAGDLR